MGKKISKLVNKFMKKVLGLIILVNIFELLIINFFPYPEVFIYPYLTSRGLLPYKQILDQHFPGLLFLPINFYSLGMRSPEAARFWQLGIVIVNHLLIFLISRKLFKSKKYIFLPNILYALSQPFYEGYVFWIDSIAPVFLLSGTYFLILKEKEKLKNKSVLLSGLFLGIGVIFKQIFLPVVGLVFLYLFLSQKDKRKSILFLFFPVVATSLLVIYFQGRGVFPDFYFWTIKFNATTFAEFGRKYPSVGDLIKSSLVFGLAGIGWLYMLYKHVSHNKFILGLFFIGGLIFAYARFDFVHLQPALPFAVLILTLFFSEIPKNKNIYLVGVVWIFVCLVLLLRFYKMNVGSRVYFFGDFESRLAKDVEKYAKPGDTIFAFATTPHIYFLTSTFPPGRLFVFNFPWFMMEAKERVLAGIASDPPKLIVKDDNAVIDGKKFIDYMGEVSLYIEKNYKTVDIIDGTKVMIPK